MVGECLLTGFKAEKARRGIATIVVLLLSVALVSGCRRKTDEVPLGEVGIDFFITLEDHESIDYQGNVENWRSFRLYGKVFTIDDDGYRPVLSISPKERLVLFDGVSEYEVREASTFFGGPAYILAGADGVPTDAPSYVVRYYRRDGEVLESRIETPEVPDFVSPESGAEWLPREQVLHVEWAESVIPIQEVSLDTMCGAPGGEWDMPMRFPILEGTQLDIDLTSRPNKQDCNNNAYMRIHQTPVSASFMDSRFLEGSYLELQRERMRSVRERT